MSALKLSDYVSVTSKIGSDYSLVINLKASDCNSAIDQAQITAWQLIKKLQAVIFQ